MTFTPGAGAGFGLCRRLRVLVRSSSGQSQSLFVDKTVRYGRFLALRHGNLPTVAIER